MQAKTIPERHFHVRDDRGRQYRVTRYIWLEDQSDQRPESEWDEVWEVLMTENGGILERLGEDRYMVDGTNTLVTGSMDRRL